jgi:hypothetical protein
VLPPLRFQSNCLKYSTVKYRCLPVSIIRVWMQATFIWKSGIHRVKTLATLSRPWGQNVPIWWACANLRDDPSYAEGAVSQGTCMLHEAFQSTYACIQNFH